MLENAQYLTVGYGKGNIYPYNSSFINASLVTPHLEKMKTINSVTVEEGDSVFFHDSSIIPRFKFLEYCKDKNIKRVINIDKSTKIVCNLKLLNGTLQTLFRKPIMVAKIDYDELDQLRSSYTIPPQVNSSSNTYLAIDTLNKIENVIKGKLLLRHSFSEVYSIYNGAVKDFKPIYDTLENISKYSDRVVTDDTLNKIMSKESIIIDKENYDQINDMLKSSDKSNITLAIEIMSNSNYIESIFYISLLLNANQNSINSVPIKNVNAKNFIEFFRDVKWMSSPYHFLSSLREKLVKEESLDETKDLYIHKAITDVVNNNIRNYGIHIEGYVTFTDNPRKTLPIV